MKNKFDKVELKRKMKIVKKDKIDSKYIEKPSQYFKIDKKKLHQYIIDDDMFKDVLQQYNVEITYHFKNNTLEVGGDNNYKVTKAKKILFNKVGKKELYIEKKEYEGKIVNIVEFGCFVEMPNGFDELIHKSKMSKEQFNNIKIDEILSVVVLKQDNDKIELVTKEFLFDLAMGKIKSENKVIEYFDIESDKNALVVDTGGNTIKEISSKYNVQIYLDSKYAGNVKIIGKNQSSVIDAKNEVLNIISKAKETAVECIIGDECRGKITNITEFGIFVKLPNKKDGLIHISRFDGNKNSLLDTYKINEEIDVVVINIDENKIHLVTQEYYDNSITIKELAYETGIPADKLLNIAKELKVNAENTDSLISHDNAMLLTESYMNSLKREKCTQLELVETADENKELSHYSKDDYNIGDKFFGEYSGIIRRIENNKLIIELPYEIMGILDKSKIVYDVDITENLISIYAIGDEIEVEIIEINDKGIYLATMKYLENEEKSFLSKWKGTVSIEKAISLIREQEREIEDYE